MKLFLAFMIIQLNSNILSQIISESNISSDPTARRKIISSDWEISWDSTIAIAYSVNSNEVDTIFYDYYEDKKGTHFGYRNIWENNQSEEWFWYFEADFTLLSVVGPYISFMYSYDGSGGVHPIIANYYRTYSLTCQSEIQLTEIFPSEDIYIELLKNSIIKKYLKNYKPKDLHDLIKNIDGGCQTNFLSMLENFAIKEISNSKAVIEFGLGHGCEVGKGTFTNFEITLLVPEKYKEIFVQAKENESYLNKMVNADFYKKLSFWSFPHFR